MTAITAVHNKSIKIFIDSTVAGQSRVLLPNRRIGAKPFHGVTP